jgi:cyclic-di-GMP phosphodiesterase, flagellum assembly factor TipF
MTKQELPKAPAGPAPGNAVVPPPSAVPQPVAGAAASDTPASQNGASEPKSRDALIFVSSVIASVAAGVMAFSQLKLGLPLAGAAGIVTLALLVLIHKQMQKSAQIAQLKTELAKTRQGVRVRAPKPAQPVNPAAALSTEARIRKLSREIGNVVPGNDSAPIPASEGPVLPDIGQGDAETAIGKFARARVQGTLNPAEAAAKTADALSATNATGSPSAPSHLSGEPAREQWAFRPRTEAQASVQDSNVAPGTPQNGYIAGAAPAAMTVEGNLEHVQRKIKELADEVNASDALRPKPARVHPAATPGPKALEDSIGALKAAAQSMRQRPSFGEFIPKLDAQPQAVSPQPTAPGPQDGFGELVIPSTAERIAGSEPVAAPRSESGFGDAAPAARGIDRDVAPPSLDLPLPGFAPVSEIQMPDRQAAIARAVEDEALHVLLGPIVTLAEHSVSHYEMTALLPSPAGELLDASEDDFAIIGGEADVRFDIARLNRAAALAARMGARDRDGSLLAEFLGTSLTSRAFLESFARAYEARQRISDQLVLTFSQSAVDAFSQSAWQAVRDMNTFGFRLAIDKVRHMGTDFAMLHRSGFRFVRIDADVLLAGLPTLERTVPAAEIIQRATLAGLSIIASGIVDGETQKRLLEAGITLGQGPLFGEARQVNVESGEATDHSAAA